MDLVAFGCGRLRPRAGDRRPGTARLLGAAEMQLKTLGSAAAGSTAVGRGCSAGQGAGEAVPQRRQCPKQAGDRVGALWRWPPVVFGGVWGGENGSAPPPSRLC